MLEEKKHTKSWEKNDTTIGEYQSLNQLYVDEGGALGHTRPDVVRSVKKYVAKCLVMGGKWVQWDGMSDQLSFVRVKKMHAEIMTEQWGVC